MDVKFRIEEEEFRRVSSLNILHFHLADCPKIIDLLDVRRDHLAVEFAKLVVEFDLFDDIAILADPDDFFEKISPAFFGVDSTT